MHNNIQQKVGIDGVVFAAVTFLCWGMTGVWVHLLQMPPIFVVGVRMSIGFLGLLPFIVLDRERRASLYITARMPITWLLAAALSTYYTLAICGFHYGTVAEVALFVGSSPLFIFLSRLWRRQPIARRETIGALVAAVGVFVVLGPKLLGGSGAASRLFGDLLALVSASTAALYAGIFRELHERRAQAPDAICVAFIACGAGGLLLTLAGALPHPELWQAASQHRNALIFLGLGLYSTSIPSVTFAIAARKLPAVLSTTSQLMIPVVAGTAAAIILHERPPLTLYIGGALILSGIIHMFRQKAAPFAEGEEPLVD